MSSFTKVVLAFTPLLVWGCSPDSSGGSNQDDTTEGLTSDSNNRIDSGGEQSACDPDATINVADAPTSVVAPSALASYAGERTLTLQWVDGSFDSTTLTVSVSVDTEHLRVRHALFVSADDTAGTCTASYAPVFNVELSSADGKFHTSSSQYGVFVGAGDTYASPPWSIATSSPASSLDASMLAAIETAHDDREVVGVYFIGVWGSDTLSQPTLTVAISADDGGAGTASDNSSEVSIATLTSQ